MWSLDLPPDDPAFALLAPAATEDARDRVCRDAESRLVVHDTQRRSRPLLIDFDSVEMRRRIEGGRRQPLARAVGLKPGRNPIVCDLTAGLGRDAATLAALGCEVHAWERHPVLFALLDDALRRTTHHGIRERLHLHLGDSRHPTIGADVVYLDPMFPDSGRRAAPGLEMQYLHRLVGADQDFDEVWSALQPLRWRTVLKRPPRGARVTVGAPDLSFGGGRACYDVYLAGG